MTTVTSSARTVLAPVSAGVPARPMVELAGALAGGGHGKAIIVSVVEVPEDHSLSEAVSPARRRRELLRRLGDAADNPANVEFTVRASRSFQDGVRETAGETKADLLLIGWRGPIRSEERLRRTSEEGLVLRPPCDLVIFKPGRAQGRARGDDAPAESAQPIWPPRTILLAVRGGPHADLALDVARRLRSYFQAHLTILKIVRDGETVAKERAPEREPDPTEQVVEVSSDSVAAAILQSSKAADLLILGASARAVRESYLIGRLPEMVADSVACPSLIVKTGRPLLAEMFGAVSTEDEQGASGRSSLSHEVDQWFAENTYHSHEFEDVHKLVDLKERQGLTVSLALPALNEEATIGRIIATLKQRLMHDVPLIDEMIVVDSDSTDRTAEIAQDLGVPVTNHSSVLPQYGTHAGKGEGLWKSLYLTRGDIVVWVDSDITDIHPKFVYGVVGPLLVNPRLGFVKGYYRRPLKMGEDVLSTGGGRVTELTARPLINLFYPRLSGLVQPLAGEMAGRRSVLESLPFFTGYGVEIGLLIDILERYGLQRLGQTDLENRIHRNQSLIALSKMAFAIVQVVMRRLEGRRDTQLLDEMNTSMKLIHYSPEELFLEVKEIMEHERPPMATIEEYRELWNRAPLSAASI